MRSQACVWGGGEGGGVIGSKYEIEKDFTNDTDTKGYELTDILKDLKKSVFIHIDEL